MPFNAKCPLCDMPAKFEPVGFLSPMRHYKCECAEFVINESSARTIAAFDLDYRRGIIDSVSATPQERLCVIDITRTGSAVDVVFDHVLRSGAFR